MLFDEVSREQLESKARRAAYLKAYHKANRQRISERKRSYYEANRDRLLVQMKAYNDANLEQIAAKKKAWREANRERLAAQQKAYYEANRERIAAQHKARSMDKAEREKIRHVLLVKQRGHCASCGVDCIENHHLDHIVPLAKGGTNEASNFQILCPPCNRNKGAADPIEFARRNGKLV